MNPVEMNPDYDTHLPPRSNEPGGNKPGLQQPTWRPDLMNPVEMNPDYDTLPATPIQ